MNKNVEQYKAPQCDVIAVVVERGYETSFVIGDWEQGGNESGDAE